MYNPFDQINRAFAHDYCVNLRIVGLDGSIMLTLSDASGIAVKHLIPPAQRNDPLRLQRVIDSIQSGLTTGGDDTLQALANLSEQRALSGTAQPALWSAR